MCITQKNIDCSPYSNVPRKSIKVCQTENQLLESISYAYAVHDFKENTPSNIQIVAETTVILKGFLFFGNMDYKPTHMYQFDKTIPLDVTITISDKNIHSYKIMLHNPIKMTINVIYEFIIESTTISKYYTKDYNFPCILTEKCIKGKDVYFVDKNTTHRRASVIYFSLVE